MLAIAKVCFVVFNARAETSLLRKPSSVLNSNSQLGWDMLYKDTIQAFRERLKLPPYRDVTPYKACQLAPVIMA